MAAGGISVETQSVFLDCLGAGYARVLDSARLAALVPVRRLLDAGVVVGLGSDWPTCPPSVVRGLRAATTRSSPAGVDSGAFGSRERVSTLEALRMYTALAARTVGIEADAGAIEPGKYADFAVWSQDLLGLEPEALGDAEPVATVVGGEVVYQSVDLG
jgi:predicted amidohydrolase YtcJ